MISMTASSNNDTYANETSIDSSRNPLSPPPYHSLISSGNIVSAAVSMVDQNLMICILQLSSNKNQIENHSSIITTNVKDYISR
jgi:hypothetical protein